MSNESTHRTPADLQLRAHTYARCAGCRPAELGGVSSRRGPVSPLASMCRLRTTQTTEGGVAQESTERSPPEYSRRVTGPIGSSATWRRKQLPESALSISIVYLRTLCFSKRLRLDRRAARPTIAWAVLSTNVPAEAATQCAHAVTWGFYRSKSATRMPGTRAHPRHGGPGRGGLGGQGRPRCAPTTAAGFVTTTARGMGLSALLTQDLPHKRGFANGGHSRGSCT